MSAVLHDIGQNNDVWVTARCGLPTASEFSKIITSKGEPSKQMGDYAAQLAAEMYAGKPLDRWGGNTATERGHELEEEARLAYSFIFGVAVGQIGFVTNHGAGASPDGLVGDDGLLEMKCVLAKNHVQLLAYFARWGKCPAEYVAQPHGQMLICDRAWVDLFFYHPALPELRIRIHRDPAFDTALLAQINAVVSERDELVKLIAGYA